MFKYTPVLGALSAALLTALPAHAQTHAQTHTDDADLASLRAQIQALRQDYEARLQQLESKLEAQARVATTPEAAASSPSNDVAPPAALASTGTRSSSFNPAVSLVLSGTYANLSKDPEDWTLSGFRLGGHGHGVGPGSRGFSLGESELTLSANVDTWAYGALTLALDADNEVEVEEAFVQTSALPHGLTLKGGRFFSALGYQNEKHAHTWDFVDLPYVHQALLGGQYKQDGAQLKWVLPTDQYLELNAELGNGASFPGAARHNNGLGSALISARTGGDLGDSHTWRLGATWLRTKAQDRSWAMGHDHDHGHGGDHEETTFTGTSRIWAIDGIWKWAPNGNAKRTNLTLQGEYFRRTESGQATVMETTPESGLYRSAQSGWYLQGVYQFVPQWRVGLRFDRLDSGSLQLGGHLDHHMEQVSHNPQRTSLMLDWSPSEFQRWRLQLGHDQARQGVKDTQVFLQYQMNLGAHGAHNF